MPSILNPPPTVDPPPLSRALRRAILIIGVFAAGFAAVFVAGVYQGYARQRATLNAVGTALKSPGVAEAEDAGCPHAMVMSADEISTLVASYAGGSRPELGVSAAVFCFGPEQLPDCGSVARGFASAPGRIPGGFFVSVERRPAKQVVCRRRYSDRGEDLGEFGPKR